MDRGDGAELTGAVIGSAVAVHQTLGPGLLESAYEECLGYELGARGIRVTRLVPLPVVYRGKRIECGYRLDMVVEDRLVVEVKSVERFPAVHSAQLLTYLKLSGIRTGLLLNFNVEILKHGIKRIVL